MTEKVYLHFRSGKTLELPPGAVLLDMRERSFVGKAIKRYHKKISSCPLTLTNLRYDKIIELINPSKRS